MKAVILAAGKGTRMRGLCQGRPKPMMPLATRPALELIVENLRAAGADDFLVVIGYELEQIKAWAAKTDFNMKFVVQTVLNGTGGATMLAEEFVNGEPFFLVFGDVIAHASNYARAAKLHKDGASAVISTFDIGEAVRIGAVFADGDRLVKIVERPQAGEVSTLVSAGIFVFPPDIFDATRDLPPAPTGEHELTAGIQLITERMGNAHVMPVQKYWANLTNPEALIDTNAKVAKELAARNATIIDSSARVHADAKLAADTAIAQGVKVEAANIGRNVSIGAGSNIKAGARLKSCILLENVQIGEGAVIENAVIQENTHVPPGAVIRSPRNSAAIVWNTTYAQ